MTTIYFDKETAHKGFISVGGSPSIFLEKDKTHTLALRYLGIIQEQHSWNLWIDSMPVGIGDEPDRFYDSTRISTFKNDAGNLELFECDKKNFLQAELEQQGNSFFIKPGLNAPLSLLNTAGEDTVTVATYEKGHTGVDTISFPGLFFEKTELPDKTYKVALARLGEAQYRLTVDDKPIHLEEKPVGFENLTHLCTHAVQGSCAPPKTGRVQWIKLNIRTPSHRVTYDLIEQEAKFELVLAMSVPI